MSGIKLHHPDLRNCTYTLIHEGRPLKAPVECWVCGMTHTHKTYHLVLDAGGDVTVSEGVFKHLEDAGLEELQTKSEVKKPEPIVLDLGDTQRPLVVSREHGPLNGSSS